VVGLNPLIFQIARNPPGAIASKRQVAGVLLRSLAGVDLVA
jgi:transposase, IS6 family